MNSTVSFLVEESFFFSFYLLTEGSLVSTSFIRGKGTGVSPLSPSSIPQVTRKIPFVFFSSPFPQGMTGPAMVLSPLPP